MIMYFCILSFGAGLLGSLAYMRMLGNTVDSMADGARGLVKYVAYYFYFSYVYLSIEMQ